MIGSGQVEFVKSIEKLSCPRLGSRRALAVRFRVLEVFQLLGVFARCVLRSEVVVARVYLVGILIDPLEFVLDLCLSFRLELVRSVCVVFSHSCGFGLERFVRRAVACNVDPFASRIVAGHERQIKDAPV